MKWVSIVPLAFAPLALACTGQVGTTTVAGPSGSSSPSPQVAAEIQAPRPSGDDDSWHSLMFLAADKVCASGNGFSARTRDVTTTDATIVMRCDGATAYVHIAFNGVTVPHLSTNPLALARRRLEHIGLTVGRVTFRSHSADAKVVRQVPKPGMTVPAGTVIDLVVGASS